MPRTLARLATLALPLSFASAMTACVSQVPLRVSSAERVPADQAHLELTADPSAVEQAVQQIAEREGLKLANKVPVPKGGTVWVFHADRADLLSIRAGGGVVVAESHGIGTWLAVRVTPAAGATRVALLAKPTVDGVEVCSDADSQLADVAYWCKDTLVRDDFDRRQLVDGRTEAEVVVRVGQALEKELAGARGAHAVPPPGTSL